MDFTTLLVSTGMSLAEKIVFSWFQEGRSSVKKSRIDDRLAELSRREAERSRLREDDIRLATERILEELVAASPKLAYVKKSLREPEVRLDVDLKDPISSNELLADLKFRLAEIADQERSRVIPQSPESVKPHYEIIPPASPAPLHPGMTSGPKEPAKGNLGQSRASELLQELAQRVDDREHPRQ